jgi:predicted DNA-binding transcriptional regulator YafY
MTYTTLAQTVALYDALHDCVFNDTALDILYASGGDTITERTIRPRSIEIGPRGSDLVFADDSLRGRVLSFRIDRFVAYASAEDC